MLYMPDDHQGVVRQLCFGTEALQPPYRTKTTQIGTRPGFCADAMCCSRLQSPAGPSVGKSRQAILLDVPTALSDPPRLKCLGCSPIMSALRLHALMWQTKAQPLLRIEVGDYNGGSMVNSMSPGKLCC